MALWHADYLDLIEAACIKFNRSGSGELVVGAVTGSLHCGYTGDDVDFTWQGHDEMDEASGEGGLNSK